jgi:Carboxypeptidase regulatory-like domain
VKLWGFYRNSKLEAKSVKQLLGLFFSVLLVAIFTLGTCDFAHAQQATERIIGNVTDPSGAGVSGVHVKATNVATRVSQETKTDREGFFEIPSLPIGTYDVRVMATGFREQVFEHQFCKLLSRYALMPSCGQSCWMVHR